MQPAKHGVAWDPRVLRNRFMDLHGTVLGGSCARIWKSQEGTAGLTVVI